ncbi:MAG: PilZ domain-containing protein, partial [Desulfobacterales bacterium]|nr:PilZ domain-containing protein [Desulfobacterales bacterium]
PDMDALWDFFFETGFIYPDKYRAIRIHQEEIKKTFEKLYLNRPDVSRHFIIQDNGVINGHIALQRVYKYTWMMHHLAARAEARIAGPKVLSLVGGFINDSYCLESNRMKYAIIYYQPENKFPNQVFGGVARNVKDPRICSLDTFAYFHIERPAEYQETIREGFHLSQTTDQDLKALETFYAGVSGGLMLEAFDLQPGAIRDDELTKAYEEAGLKRERYLFSLKKNGATRSIIMIHLSDMGVNLSGLTSCMHVFVPDPGAVSKKAMMSALSFLSQKYARKTVAVNLLPVDYAKKHSLCYEKQYTLWTYEMSHSDYYYAYLKRLSRFFKV